MKVKFGGVKSYLDELDRDRPKLIRVTKSFALSDGPVTTRRVSVVATHVSSDGQLVRLDRYIGDMWALDVDDRNRKIMDLADHTKKQIAEKAESLLIEVCGGVLEESI